jgi:hypothetical protein
VIWSHIQSEYQQVYYLLRHIITSELVITEERLHEKTSRIFRLLLESESAPLRSLGTKNRVLKSAPYLT